MPDQTYHHGNLRETLIEVGFKLARTDGPQALGLRDIARLAGVSPSAVYRHFPSRGALFAAIKGEIQPRLVASMQQELDTLPIQDCPDTESALAQIRAVCRGYLNFAFTEPGLFRTGFSNDLPQNESIAALPDEQNKPFILLVRPVRRLVELGYLEPERELPVELAIWSSVHGLATLLLDGPLAQLAPDQRQAVIIETIEITLRGIRQP